MYAFKLLWQQAGCVWCCRYCLQYLTRQGLANAGLPTPRNARISKPEDVEPAGQHVGFPSVIKPVSGAHAQLYSPFLFSFLTGRTVHQMLHCSLHNTLRVWNKRGDGVGCGVHLGS